MQEKGGGEVVGVEVVIGHYSETAVFGFDGEVGIGSEVGSEEDGGGRAKIGAVFGVDGFGVSNSDADAHVGGLEFQVLGRGGSDTSEETKGAEKAGGCIEHG